MIEQLFSQALVHAIGWTLIHTLWQGALFALLLGAALILLRKFSAQARYVAATGLLSAFFLTVIFTFSQRYAGFLVESTSEQGLAIQQDPAQIGEPSLSGQAVVISDEEMLVATEEVTTVSPPSPPSFKQRVTDYYDAHLPLIVTLWLMGVLVLQLRFLGQLAFVQRLKVYGTERFPSTWAKQIQELEERLKIKKSVKYLTSFRVQSPQTVGWLRPVILFPSSLLAELKDTQVVSILAHELAHIKRNDFLINLLQTFLCTLFFYHPGLWWMSARIKEEREHCCDDLAIQITGKPIGYAKTLIQLKEKEMSPQQLALAYLGHSQKGFHWRIKRLVSGYFGNATYSEGIITALLLILALGGAMYASDYEQQLQEIQQKVELTSQESTNATPPPSSPVDAISTTANLTTEAGFETSIDLVDEVDLNTIDSKNFDLFMEAVYEGNLRLVEYFLEQGGIDINQTDHRNFTPLMAAASEDHPEIAQALINKGAKVNYVNTEGWTALIEAADEGAYATTIVLLQSGADINLRGANMGMTALGMAASEGNSSIIRLLIDAGADITSGQRGTSPLHLAAEEGRKSVVKLLLDLGAPVDSKDEHERTALSYAAEENKLQVVRQLLAAGADPNLIDASGRSALNHAAREGAADVLAELMQANPQAKQQALDPKVLIEAAREGEMEIVISLLAAGAKVNTPDEYGNTALAMAAREGEVAVARYLLDQGADVNSRSGENVPSPLFLAARESSSEMIRLLIERGARIEAVHSFQSFNMKKWGNQNNIISFYKKATPLIAAIEEDDPASVQMLLNYKPDVNASIAKMSFTIPQNMGWDDLTEQTEKSLKENHQLRYDVQSWTPLMEAVETGNLEIVNLLLEAGANPKAATDDGLTPLSLARQLKHAAIIKRLQRL